MSPLDLTVIIPVRDSREHLAGCLQYLSESQATPAEVIVVDDGSRDEPGEAAREYGVRILKLDGKRGPAAARNAGARAARCPILMFLDADVRVHPDTVGRAYEALAARDTIGAVFGAYDDRPLAPGLVSQYRNLLHHFTHCSAQTRAWTFWAGCGVIRRNLFLQHGGFDERYRTPSVEDIELGMRLTSAGVEILLVPEVQVCHAKSWTLWSMMRTDIARRAWPWSRLLAGSVPDDLNLRWDQRAGALCAWLTVGFAGAVWFSRTAIWGMLFGATATALSNRRFLGFLARLRGPGFAARAFPLHLLFLLYSSATFAAGTAAGLAVAWQAPRRERP